ncbi:asparagine--tRNA ligase [Plebeiibacterium sediminum]|uniref:Asparagine--tRNA ligase n=1 Tax=Plebeiibacterium sediminum TaxID=2992112 RepID=A0AAE3SGX5_9BACT|nr:asparagine--tRNA ligase [Plebeiobacterium sediminum]MCW3788761.1 asparagine--tRNA ligase [Plebeiobacterium sediminum]
MRRTKVAAILKDTEYGKEVNIKGWVRTRRGNKFVNFIALNDGSSIHNLQIVADVSKFDESLIKRITTGSAISVVGTLSESAGGGQKVEVQANTIEILGDCNADEYPLQPKKHSLEFLREIAHLRFRTNTFGAITRVRHAMIFAVHKFFSEKGFYNIHTPIITASDAEGAGEMFRVTTMDVNNIPKTEEGKVDYSQDFFGKSTNLTVSGQLEGELAALAMSEIYTFGPTFRAENSNTARHLAEFWMIEPEMAFYDLNDNMDLAEEFTKYLLNYALENCSEDLEFLSNRQKEEEKNKKDEDRSMELIEKLKFVVDNDYVRLTYSEAIDILMNSKPHKKGKFQYPITGFGSDLQAEHERYLVEKHFKKPVILTDYPMSIKAFYMKQSEDGKTVRAMDVLFPQIGEIIGGSQREEDYNKLLERMRALDLPEEEMYWYLDTRRFGSVPHSGFGLGFERLMLFVTGMGNIRDVIPFPRTPKNAEF